VNLPEEPVSFTLNFNISFADRQKLHQLDDYIIDLQVILPTMLENVTGLQKACTDCCSRHCINSYADCMCVTVYEEFGGAISQIKEQLGRANSLRERALSIAKLVRRFHC
jgi:hypothetical protein